MHVGVQEILAHYPSGLQEGQEGLTTFLMVKETRLSYVVKVIKNGPSVEYLEGGTFDSD